MRISAIQSRQYNLYDVNHPGDFDIDKCRSLSRIAVDEAFEMIDEAGRNGAKLIVTVEGMNVSVLPNDKRYDFVSTAEPMDGPIIKRLGCLAKRHGAYIVGGLYTARNGKAYNSAVLFAPDGSIVGVFDKVHLPAGEEIGVTPGNCFPVFETDYGKIGMLICWDMQFPEAAREIALAGADLIACPTWGWENIYGLCRAYENSVAIVAAMSLPPTGMIAEGADPSCIVDNMGRIRAAGSRTEPGIITAEMDIRQEPPLQYGINETDGFKSMRHIRMLQRRPDTYKRVTELKPEVMDRYR